MKRTNSPEKNIEETKENINLISTHSNKQDSFLVYDYHHLDKIKGATEPKQVHEKLGLHKRSITLDTLNAIIFETSAEDLYYKEYYEHKGNKVSRFAINCSEIKVDIEDKKILGESADLIDTTKQVEKSAKSSQYKLENAQQIVHHSLEKQIVQEAISELLAGDGKTILVDIFARVNGAVKILKDGIPETHTILLYKNPAQEEKHEISVIDPSNFLFSSHIANLNHVVAHDKLNKITTLHKGLQIYTPIKENIGSKSDQWRECIDIAVKLAFGFNKIGHLRWQLKEKVQSFTYG